MKVCRPADLDNVFLYLERETCKEPNLPKYAIKAVGV